MVADCGESPITSAHAPLRFTRMSTPGPNKEKYVVKRLLRRAVLDGHQIGLHAPFLHQLVPKVVELMRHPYPELPRRLRASSK